MRTRMYGGVGGRKTKVGRKLTFVFLLPDFCAFMEILKTVHESVVKLWFVFQQVCQESEIPVKFGETDNASELWLIQ